jgi:hypothetical protein
VVDSGRAVAAGTAAADTVVADTVVAAARTGAS